jgi:hypothetical protein
MKQIEIPFLERFREDVGTAQKIMTTRTKKYGEVGDFFWVTSGEFRIKYVLLSVFTMRLWHVGQQFYQAEGFSSPDEFIKVWNQIHSRKSYEETKQNNFWVHIFSPAHEWAGYEPTIKKVKEEVKKE